jgi:hypothetical protein
LILREVSIRPSAEVVHRIHDRYLIEVVEELGLCPFARRSRELGRVHRPLLWIEGSEPTPARGAHALADCIAAHPDAEIVLLTFLDDGVRFATPAPFEAYVAELRAAYEGLGGPRWFMVAFHPGFAIEEGRALTKDSLVPLIRRSPDPVIQCVNARVLERARAQAQDAAHRRLVDTLGARDPLLRAMIENSVQADSELSADIARTNFAAVGRGAGREAFERVLADIHRDRDLSYNARGL